MYLADVHSSTSRNFNLGVTAIKLARDRGTYWIARYTRLHLIANFCPVANKLQMITPKDYNYLKNPLNACSSFFFKHIKISR